MAWQSGAQVDLESRITKMMEMFTDFESFGLTKHANTAESLQSNLASAEQTLQNLTTTVLDPILNFIKKITKYFEGFTIKTHIIDPIIDGIKTLLDIGSLVSRLVQGIKDWWNGADKKKEKKNKKNEDNATNTP
ncbi:hypothetical protein HNP67_001317 [Borreliella californiensis]|uniref:Uncharacterized protein n=1 Tax=Borreliella californiensis TaxID=373543 RepID=A0A7W9ZNU9_9SPIR|nr:hypothetical protein [Borreliella californiensis]